MDPYDIKPQMRSRSHKNYVPITPSFSYDSKFALFIIVAMLSSMAHFLVCEFMTMKMEEVLIKINKFGFMYILYAIPNIYFAPKVGEYLNNYDKR